MALCGWSTKQTIPLSALARNQTKGLESRSPTRLEVGKGTPEKAVRKRNPEKAVGEGWGRRESKMGSRRDQSAWDRFQAQWGRQARWVCSPESTTVSNEEDGQRWVGIPSTFVEISWKIYVSVSLQMRRDCNVTEPPFLHSKLTQDQIVRLSFVLFLPLPRLY